MEDGSIVIFGAGKIAERVYERIGQENIAAVIDNNVQRQGELFKGTIRIISLDEYIKRYYEKKILIASMYVKEIEEQLKSKRVYNYDIAVEVFKAEDVKEDEDIGQEGQNSADAGDDSVNDQRLEQGTDIKCVQAAGSKLRDLL